jgi:CelD/BcsL family acetyltransferase involved in cellulose biosynthesis
VLRGGAAVREGIGPARRAEWQRLADTQDKVTVFDEPAFVLTWYDVYEPEHEPLLLIGLDRLDRLVGVMPLAVAREGGGSLAFAGAEQAEYAGWLASPEVAREFPTRCVLELRERGIFRRPWRWRWLAPGTDVEGLDAETLRRHGLAIHVSRTEKSLWSLQGPKPVRFSVDNRKVNRLRRQGEVRVVQLDSAGLTDDVFRLFTTTHDIRELQIRGFDPFRTNPLKGVFHRRLVDRAADSVLFYCLMVGLQPVAFSFNIRDRRRLIFCLDAFDPRWAASSPGKLINNLVADAVAARGVHAIDLTPGGDSYKEEVANESEPIHSVLLFPRASGARLHDLKTGAERVARRAVLATGLSPERGRTLAGLARRLATGALVRDGVAAGRRWAASRETVLEYELGREATVGGSAGAPPARAGALEDFLLYSGEGGAGSRQAVMQDALSRLRRGQQCYTSVEDGRLAHAGWLEMEAKTVSLGDEDSGWSLPPKTARLHVVPIRPGPGAAPARRELLRLMARDAFAAGAERVVALVAPDRALLEALEAAGFAAHRRLVIERRFGRVRRLEQPA